MLMAVPDLMFLQTRDGVYLDYYARDLAKLYVPPEMFLGRSMTDVLPGDVAAEFFRAFDRVTPAADPVEVEYSLPLGDDLRHFEARLVCVDDDRIMSMVRDITDQKRAELSLQHSEHALRESHARIKQLARRLIAAQERERSRVARELHDDLSQKLALLTIGLNQLADETDSGHEQRRERIRLLTTQAADIARDVHHISHALHPSMLAPLGAVRAVEKYCAEFAASHALTIEFTYEGRPVATSPDVDLCAFRIVQEALQNAARHSGTNRLSVRLARHDDWLLLQIGDRGRGFDPDEAERRGLGLVSMRERVDALGGEFTLHAAVGQGTRISARLPLSGSAV